MRLDKLTVAVTERRPWEAVDLGFTMTRAWAGPLYRVWLAVFLPVSVAVMLACYQLPWLGALILWWLKPLLDRVPLHVLSRALFGETVTPGAMWRALPRLWWRDLPRALTLERISGARSLVLPVSVLEELKGKARRARARTIAGTVRGTAVALTLGCLHIEQALMLGGLALLYLFVPPQYDFDFGALLQGEMLWLVWLSNALYVIVIGALEPFYVASGFGLYLNRRIVLEGWDIELTFRRMAQSTPDTSRAAGLAAAVALAVGVFLIAGAPPAHTAPPPSPAPEEIQAATEQVLAAPEFQAHEEITRWRFKKNPDDSSSLFDFDIGPWPARVVRGLMWAAAGLALVLLLRAMWNSGLPQQALRGISSAPTANGAPAIAPLAAPAEPLPGDIPAAARAALARGDTLAALSLLYRGALRALAQRRIELPDGATEGEWLRAAERANTPGVGYLRELIHLWRGAAYARRVPAAASVAALCDGFENAFTAAGATPS